MNTKSAMRNKAAIELVTRNNPFLLSDTKGKLIMYNFPHEPYYSIMTAYKRFCYKGYVELKYILSCLYPDFTNLEIKKMVQKMNVPNQEIVLLHYGDKRCKLYFEQIFVALHSYFGSHFQRDHFERAYELAKASWELQDLKINGNDDDNSHNDKA